MMPFQNWMSALGNPAAAGAAMAGTPLPMGGGPDPMTTIGALINQTPVKLGKDVKAPESKEAAAPSSQTAQAMGAQSTNPATAAGGVDAGFLGAGDVGAGGAAGMDPTMQLLGSLGMPAVAKMLGGGGGGGQPMAPAASMATPAMPRGEVLAQLMAQLGGGPGAALQQMVNPRIPGM